ncbi:postacrosomal sheath WW domain-binding protein-like [Brachypodium distachyon]|uniref:Uncharacterized protein n=1 Tax=Brachypodium distachyon TaxID=15368 RepID=A0A2K2CLZ4_BRADI|nr:postacrosomal sheath WW domain-binding protein-like [Brachypodium distachyon]PNT63048.1 hypothetical protein BRADI_4g10888v3 [Brachypodium distachyon]|eukprot:XP_024318803.1 postacrosomal sheath WW domain-binding protein-like [Brachypodium distachyon]
MGQVTVAAAGGCCGAGSCSSKLSRPETKRTEGVLCAVFSWIAAAVAFGTLVFGAAWNDNQPRDPLASFPVPACYVLLDRVFAGAAVLTLAATVLGLASYVLLRGKPAAAAAPNTGEQRAGRAPPSTYPYAPPYQQFPTQGYGAHEPSTHFPQGFGGHAPNQHVPHQGYGAHVPNLQFPPQGYGAHEPNTQFPPQGHGTHARNLQFPPQGHWAQQFHPQGHWAHAPNQQFHPQGLKVMGRTRPTSCSSLRWPLRAMNLSRTSQWTTTGVARTVP